MTLARVPAALAALALVLSFASTARPALASCGFGASLEDAYAASSAVFVGRATSISLDTKDPTMPDRLVTFEVEEAIKGEAAKQLVVSMGADTSESLRIEESHEYLIFAALVENGRLAAGGCGLSGPLAASAAPLAFCRYVARSGRTPSVVGCVVENTPTGPMFGGSGNEGVALGGVGVTLESGGRRFEAVTDRDGGFAVADVPKGDYTAKLALPDGYRLTRFQSTGLEEKAGVSVVRVGMTCAVVYAEATRGGAVAGRFLDAAGKPVAGFDLALVARDGLRRMAPTDVVALSRTEDDGRFRFDPVPPGEYALVANWMPSPKLDVPPRTRFVVAKTPDVAMTYAVSAGRETSAGDLKAPEPPAYVTLDVEVVDEKGAPVNAATLIFSDAAGKPFGLAIAFERGRVRVYLPAERPCTVTVRAGTQPSEPVAIDPAKVGPTLRLVVAR